MTDADTTTVAAWLANGAHPAVRAEDLLDELCAWLSAFGIPLSRAALFVRTLRPGVTGRRYLWRSETGTVAGTLSFELLDTDGFRVSPVTHVYATCKPLRRRIADAAQASDFEVLRILHAEGATDYLASPLLFTEGSVHVATWTTHARGGFAPVYGLADEPPRAAA
jgi:adenylate cyclase